MVKEILLGNLEGLLTAILAYLIFVKYFPLEKIENETPYEKPLSLKRLRYALPMIVYFVLTFYLLVVQSRRSSNSEPFSIMWKIYFTYLCLSIFVFVGCLM